MPDKFSGESEPMKSEKENQISQEFDPKINSKEAVKITKAANEAKKNESRNLDQEIEKLKEDAGLTEEREEFSPEFIKNIEDSKLGIVDKVNLLLVKKGLKPAAEIYIAIKGEQATFLADEDLESMKSLIEESGLAYDAKEQEVNSIKALDILISQSKEKVERLRELWKAPKEENNSREIGMLLGYPSTAIDAFVAGLSEIYGGKKNKEVLDENDLADDIRKVDAVVFSKFALSKKNWLEEIGQGKIWADYIKSASPKIYQEMMERDSKMQEQHEKLLKMNYMKSFKNLWDSLRKKIFG